MPSTADEQVAAARIVFGQAQNDKAMKLMKQWLNVNCRDWRFESGDDIPEGEVVAAAVFATPLKAQNLRMQVAQNVKRWGFLRRGHH